MHTFASAISLAVQSSQSFKKNSRARSLHERNSVHTIHFFTKVHRKNIYSRRNRNWRVKAIELCKRRNWIIQISKKVVVETLWKRIIDTGEYSYTVTKHSRSEAFLVKRIWTTNWIAVRKLFQRLHRKRQKVHLRLNISRRPKYVHEAERLENLTLVLDSSWEVCNLLKALQKIFVCHPTSNFSFYWTNSPSLN